jgi:hypothetical protein
MSSVVIWRSPCGRVAASWNKSAPYSVAVLGDPATRYRTAAAAIRAARRAARRLPPADTGEGPAPDHPLADFAGHRVEVIDREGEPPRRFWVEGSGAGYLELATRRSYGGRPAASRYAAVRWLPPSPYLIAAARRDLAANLARKA